MVKKELVLILGFLLLGIMFFNLTSAEGCCLETDDGDWCVDVEDQGNCDSYVPTPCASYSLCKSGTCVNEDTGECSSNVYKAACTRDLTGDWYDLPKEDIIVNGVYLCRQGCCKYGGSTAFTTFTECKALSSLYGVPLDFDSSVTEEAMCSSLAQGNERGACIYNSGQAKDCSIESKEDCLSYGGDFHERFLCSAPQLGTMCAKSKNTKCHRDKVYFLDTCGNLANVYDKDKIDNADYWTYIRDEEVCEIPEGSSFSSSCGNCDVIEGTVCRSYEEAKQSQANEGIEKPEAGNYVCASMDCVYKGQSYNHGESWCGDSEGIVPPTYLEVTNDTLEFVNDTRGLLLKGFEKSQVSPVTPSFEDANYNNFNLPGSRYHRLSCFDGEVYVDSCEDMRKEICVQSDMGEQTQTFKIANCVRNDWISCFNKTSRDECEETIFCKWSFGYRWDMEKLTDIHDRNEHVQGSCVPMFSPGFKFWSDPEETDTGEIRGQDVCNLASVSETVEYQQAVISIGETGGGQGPVRDLCDIEGGDQGKDAASDCIDNCYLIPTYGLKKPDNWNNYFSLEQLMDVHKGNKENRPDDVFNRYCISDRKAYYCNDAAGPVGGRDVDCAKRESRRRDMPLFFTHQEWIYSIKDRARSLGDCGYKPGILMEEGHMADLNENLESVSAIFSRINEQGETRKEYEAQKVYERDFEFIETFHNQ